MAKKITCDNCGKEVGIAKRVDITVGYTGKFGFEDVCEDCFKGGVVIVISGGFDDKAVFKLAGEGFGFRLKAEVARQLELTNLGGKDPAIAAARIVNNVMEKIRE